MSTQENAVAGKYKCTLPWASARTDDAAAKRAAYRAEDSRLSALFKADLYAEHDVSGPGADAVYAKAYERGHADGYGEVATIFEDLLDILIAVNKAHPLAFLLTEMDAAMATPNAAGLTSRQFAEKAYMCADDAVFAAAAGDVARASKKLRRSAAWALLCEKDMARVTPRDG